MRIAESSYPTIPLTSDEIHVWLSFYDQRFDQSLYAVYRQLLDETERQREKQFYFATERRRFLVTRALVRTTLSRYISIHPKQWIFTTNSYGRPQIANPQANIGGMQFNIAHTQNLVALGVTRDRCLGVDVENVSKRRASIEVAQHYFSPDEVALLHAVSPEQQDYRFLEYWTFKEAYIKARGMGLSLPLDKISFHYPQANTVELRIHSDLADDPARWQFWQFQPTADYLLAICGQRMNDRSPRLISRTVIPLISEEEVEMEPHRRTHEN
jgi:4'-phosphopantetheinyl transferase